MYPPKKMFKNGDMAKIVKTASELDGKFVYVIGVGSSHPETDYYIVEFVSGELRQVQDERFWSAFLMTEHCLEATEESQEKSSFVKFSG